MESAVTYKNLGLPAEWYGALEWVFPEWARAHALDRGEAVNILKGAIVTTDRILTVSEVCCISYIFLCFVSFDEISLIFLITIWIFNKNAL